MLDLSAAEMTARNITHRIDDSAVAIGRRYARTDEIAIPFGITVDFVTKPNGTVTLRERDTTKQVRIPVSCMMSGADASKSRISEEIPTHQSPKLFECCLN